MTTEEWRGMKTEELARGIKLLVLDVDGVLTDGGLWYDVEGRIMKRFNVQDGLGIKALQHAGGEVAVISGLAHEGVAARVRELGITRYAGGHFRKVPLLDDMRRDMGISWEQIAYMGDDWVDAAPMKRVGLPMAVANAQPEILQLARWVASKAGGQGAVREAVRFLLEAQGRLQSVWDDWSA